MSTLNTSRSLSQWLDYIESIHPSEIELGLTRVATVADRLGLLDALAEKTVISVAGTNGKGSCVASMEALLAVHPSRPTFGVYTSPHFIQYNERIRVNAQSAQDADICLAFAAIECARAEISLSYFEFATLAALHVFVEAACDFIILEVGLGGRLDAVNIVDADVAVVTSIALDHQDWLGSDLGQIAREKAGIFRPGKIAISASDSMPPSIAQVASELAAEHWQAQRDFHYQTKPSRYTDATVSVESAIDDEPVVDNEVAVDSEPEHNPEGEVSLKAMHEGLGQRLVMQLARRNLEIPLPSLPTPSVVAACLALELLDVLVADEELEQALLQIQLTGRCQRIHWRGRDLVLDVAHNPAASEHLLQRLSGQKIRGKKQFLLLGAMEDKDLAGIIKPWQGEVDIAYACDLPNTPRAASAKLLYSKLVQYKIKTQACENVAAALEASLKQSKEGDRLVIMGSFFTVAAALSYLQLA